MMKAIYLIFLLLLISYLGYSQDTTRRSKPQFKNASDSLMHRFSARPRPVAKDTGKVRTQWSQHNTAAAVNNPPGQQMKQAGLSPIAENNVSNLDNGIEFNITNCVGHTHDQTVTIFFTIANPHKPHQLIGMSLRKFNQRTNALDAESNTFDAAEVTLAGESLTNIYKSLNKQLPTGNKIKGSVTFVNVLSSVQRLSLVNILALSCNWVGGGDKKEGAVELQNVPITWGN